MSNTIKERITAVEVKLEELISNHLPHLESKVDKLDTRIWWLLSTVILGFLISIALTLWQ